MLLFWAKVQNSSVVSFVVPSRPYLSSKSGFQASCSNPWPFAGYLPQSSLGLFLVLLGLDWRQIGSCSGSLCCSLTGLFWCSVLKGQSGPCWKFQTSILIGAMCSLGGLWAPALFWWPGPSSIPCQFFGRSGSLSAMMVFTLPFQLQLWRSHLLPLAVSSHPPNFSKPSWTSLAVTSSISSPTATSATLTLWFTPNLSHT